MPNLDHVSKILAVLAAAYPSFALKRETISVYTSCLADLDPDMLDQAAKAIIASSRFFPTVAELREKAAELNMSANGIQEGMDAWEELMRSVRRYGHTLYGGDSPHFENPVLERTVCALGWNSICLSEAAEEILRAQFLKTYNAYIEREKKASTYLPETRQYAGLPEPGGNGKVTENVRLLAGKLGRH